MKAEKSVKKKSNKVSSKPKWGKPTTSTNPNLKAGKKINGPKNEVNPTTARKEVRFPPPEPLIRGPNDDLKIHGLTLQNQAEGGGEPNIENGTPIFPPEQRGPLNELKPTTGSFTTKTPQLSPNPSDPNSSTTSPQSFGPNIPNSNIPASANEEEVRKSPPPVAPPSNNDQRPKLVGQMPGPNPTTTLEPTIHNPEVSLEIQPEILPWHYELGGPERPENLHGSQGIPAFKNSQEVKIQKIPQKLDPQNPENPLEPIPHVHDIIEKTRRTRRSDGQPGTSIKTEHFDVSRYSQKPAHLLPNPQKRAQLITAEMLYKEALYTSVHYLGLPSIRLPSTKEDLCLYSHLLFNAEPKEQMAVMEHVVSEAFPLIVVNTNVRRADGVEARESKNLPDPYCVVAMESQQSGIDFQISAPAWEEISTGTPLRPKTPKKQAAESTRPVPEKRFDQYYATVPPAIKTSVQSQTRNPAWNQRFQCLALRPSVDLLTIEIWDNRSELTVEGKEKKDKRNKPKHADVFLGKVSIPVKDIPCEGEAKWHYIRGTTHSKKPAVGRLLVEVWLTHAYRHGKNYEEYVEPRIMLEMFWDRILLHESRRFTGEWNGELPPAATCLTFQYALQTGLSEATQAIIRWNAYAKYSLGLFALERRLTELELALERARDWKDVRECELESNLIMVAVEKILPVIRNHLHETEETVHEAVKAIKHCRDILSKFQCQPGHLAQVQFWVESEIRMAILEWYEAKFMEFLGNHQRIRPDEVVECLARVISEVNRLLRECAAKWKPLFWLDGLISYMPLAYDELQKMVIHDVETVCHHAMSRYDTNDKLRRVLMNLDAEARALCRGLFDLYVETQVFVTDQETFFESTRDRYYHLNRYHRWFRPVLVLWLGYALIRAADMISHSIKVDNVIIENDTVMTSSSATDAGMVYHQLANFWQQLNWPDVAEGYVVLHYLFEVMCFVTILYARLKRQKLEKEGYFDTVDRFDISERFCTALNNIEHVKESLIKIPDAISMDSILVELDEAVGESFSRNHRVRINNLLTGTLGHVELQFKKILRGVAERVRPEIREAFRECYLFLEDMSKTEDDALIPVLSYLEDNIVVLHKSLLELNFIRVLQMFWNVTCQEMLHGLRLFSRTKDVRKHEGFFQRVHNILPLIVTYFEGSGGGLNETEIETKYYRSLLVFLKCLNLPTEALIAAYYRDEADEQLAVKTPSKLGTLKVRVSYHSGVLTVEIISARNLSARDEPTPFFRLCNKMQEPSSDPQVEVRPFPPQNFPPGVRSQKTEIKWKTQNPMFNETFSWRIPEESCSKGDSVLLFTVKDVDLVSRDDFLGQAVIPIAQMPGIMRLRPAAQPMQLELRSVDVEHNPVLSILASRRWDSAAQDFVREMEKRVVTLKEDTTVRLNR